MIPAREAPSFKTEGWSKELREFVGLCLHKDAEARPSASTLLNHELVKQGTTLGEKTLKDWVDSVLPAVKKYREKRKEDKNKDTGSSVSDMVTSSEEQKNLSSGSKLRINTLSKSFSFGSSDGGTTVINPSQIDGDIKIDYH